MGDNHPSLNSHGFVEQALQRLVQGRVIDQFTRPYYVSTSPSKPLLRFFLAPSRRCFPATVALEKRKATRQFNSAERCEPLFSPA